MKKFSVSMHTQSSEATAPLVLSEWTFKKVDLHKVDLNIVGSLVISRQITVTNFIQSCLFEIEPGPCYEVNLWVLVIAYHSLKMQRRS